MTDHLAIAQAAVDKAAAIVRERQIGARTAKGDRDYATEADFASEDAVRAFLREATPNIPLLGEERGLTGSDADGLLWTLDPIDGTVNYAHGVPLCAVSLALLENGTPIVGVIGLPFLATRFHATQGGGAFQDGEPISASDTTTLSEALVSIGDYAVGTNAETKNRARLALTTKLIPEVQRLRMFGSAAIDLAWVANGTTDAVVMLSNNSWDVMAGVVIAREAGAIVLGADGEPHSLNSAATIAVAPGLVPHLMRLIS